MSQELKQAAQAALDALDLHAEQYPHMVKGYTLDAAEGLRAALARTHQPEADPIAEGIGTVSASASKSADDGAWKKLFWEVSRQLNCLPSSFVDSNDHVLKKARELTVAQQPAQVAPDVDALAQFIRQVDGNHTMGAGVLAEKICEWLAASQHGERAKS